MVKDHPVFGVGPNMVEVVYPQYRVAEAVEQVNPHLHNVPMQIAAERGLPALALWVGFIGVFAHSLYERFRSGRARTTTTAAMAALVGMLAAGLFEYNFGDSEFLMLFLMLATLPFAGMASTSSDSAQA